MNYETLNNNVMLVELSPEEMKRFHITYDTLSSDSKHTETIIRKILNEISQEKFKIKDKIIVEALPTDNGGCFFIFTFSEKKIRYKVKRSNSDVFFCADNLNDLLDSIASLQKQSTLNSSCQIFKMNNLFYLQLSPCHKPLHSILKEFGCLINSFSKEMLNEYGEYMGEIML